MKCPKCGFTSFDDLHDCKKCGSDLTAFKSKFNLRGLFRSALPLAGPLTPAPSAPSQETPPPEPVVPAATEATDFGYDFMDEAESPAPPLDSLDDLLDPDAPVQLEEFDFDEAGAPGEIPQAKEVDLLGGDDLGGFGEDPLDLGLDTWSEKGEGEIGVSGETAGEIEAFELPNLDDLPPLDEDVELSTGEPEELPDSFGDLPDFEELEEEAPASKAKGGRRDPFDARGSVAVERAPAPPLADRPVAQTTTAELAPELHHLPSLPAPPLPDPCAPAKGSAPRATETGASLIGLRLRAGFVDGMILCLSFALFLVAGEMILQGGILPSAASVFPLLIPYLLIFFFLCFGYFTLFHCLAGQTVGKMIFRLRVEGADGDPALFSQTFLRSAGGVVCLLAAGLGFLLGWNDRLAGTRVVRVEEDEEGCGEEEFAQS